MDLLCAGSEHCGLEEATDMEETQDPSKGADTGREMRSVLAAGGVRRPSPAVLQIDVNNSSRGSDKGIHGMVVPTRREEQRPSQGKMDLQQAARGPT
jgi:hypothetical protein